MPLHTDFTVENHGSIFLLEPHTREAHEWADKHLPPDALTLGNAIAVEHGYIIDILRAIVADGLEVR